MRWLPMLLLVRLVLLRRLVAVRGVPLVVSILPLTRVLRVMCLRPVVTSFLKASSGMRAWWDQRCWRWQVGVIILVSRRCWGRKGHRSVSGLHNGRIVVAMKG